MVDFYLMLAYFQVDSKTVAGVPFMITFVITTPSFLTIFFMQNAINNRVIDLEFVLHWFFAK